MCILIYDWDVEIQSPKQLEDHFPQITKMIPAEGYDISYRNLACAKWT